MKDELISIIVPIYNSSKTIEKCLNSLINQTYKNIEIILIDDGSSDNSYNICLKYASIDSRIKIIKQKNSGVSSARNKGLEICKGQYVGFVDSDDYIEKNMYLNLYNSLKENNSKMAICNYYFEDSMNNQLLSFQNNNLTFKSKMLPNYMMNLLCINGFLCNKLYSRDLIINKKFSIKLDENIGMMEDNLFNYNIYDLNPTFNCTYINEKLYHYIQNRGSACNKKYSLEKLQYFIVRNKQIEILRKRNMHTDFLKVDYIFNFIKDSYKIDHLGIKKNELFYELENYYTLYLKNINTKYISRRLRLKYYLSKYFPYIIRFLVIVKKENI